ncbi:MAG TPA: hypothetical protein VLI06_07500 [Solimonas sp.]|nr:hypothetical protein [Solimonas sp.]
MSILLVAPPELLHSRWIRRIFAGTELVVDDSVGDCRGIVVINDHSAEVVGRLQRALELREHHQELPVAMLTAIEAPDLEALIRLLNAPGPTASVPTGQALAAIVAERLPAQVKLGAQAINFEYDA